MEFRIISQRTGEDPLTLLRKRFVQSISIAILLTSMGGVVAQLLVVRDETLLPGLLATFFIALLQMGVVWLAFTERVREAAYLLIGTLAAVLWLIDVTVPVLVLAPITIVCAAALANRPVYILVNFIVFSRLTVELVQIVRAQGFEQSPEGIAVVSTFSSLIIISFATRFLIDSAERTARLSTRNAELLQATAEIGQVTSNLLKQDELFNRAVEMIRDRFNFYHVQIFMIDEDRRYARLVASTGEVGQKLLARNHRLAVGSQSVIGRVTQIGETVVASDTDKDAVHAVNELLPNTRSELALPIIDTGQIIGALDVQSTERNAFTSSDIQALQVMANQLATVIRNARLFEERESNFQLSQRLLLEARTNLREIQRLNSQLSKNAWEEYLGGKQEQPGVILAEDEPRISANWTDEMVEAVNEQRPVTRREGERRVTAVPIVLRGEVLGAIEVESDEVRESDLAEMVQAVAQNLATSLESARLFEEAQEATAQEQRINAITEKYQSAATVDDLLKITMDELSRTLGAAEGAIRVGNLNTKPNDHTESNRVKLNGHRLNGGGNHA
jgi:GAF domain-containing protein